ncbi:DEAD-box ATP-dependent RNA helicase 14 [Acorus gramineus]|uniref:RNA helicase n=1 Tax=Acorus gramineus TaxID=55184 RepID=A0AAV9BTC1_ACOGR|nr:DEAD-box ATP-dependent RNA helicase 14 [Acorus gramineus]
MTMTASANPRYAPDDPTLPKPWKGLVDGTTGYLYFWNPVTNVTQYDRPSETTPAGPLPSIPPKSALFVASSVHVKNHREEDDRRYSDGPKQSAEVGGRNLQGSRTQGHGDGGGGMPTEYRRHHEITVSGDNVPPPFSTFESTGFPSEILREVQSAGFSAPTPIQAQSWPIALQSRDIVAIAKTGSGKTLGYLIPGFIHLKRVRNNSQMGPTVLVLSPTRELATQIQEEAVKFGRSSRISCTMKILLALSLMVSATIVQSLLEETDPLLIRQVVPMESADVLEDDLNAEAHFTSFLTNRGISHCKILCLYGGAPKGPQLRDLQRGVDVVVATPGRLNDFLEARKVSLRQVSYLVLDEADRMLDMGFEPQIRKIVKEIPPRRQTLMYTATWPKEVRKIAADLLIKPVQVNIGNINELVANKAITQCIEVITPMEKQRRLEQILRSQDPGSKIIVFCSTKRMCDQLARSLTRQFGAAAIHGDKSQGERDYVLGQFRTGRSPILVATDVAARGLDIKDIRVVVNYDFPTGVEDYVHRIGRTGRAGATGVSYTFFCDQDAKHAKDLIKVLEGSNQRVPSEIRDMASRSGGFGRPRSRWGSGGGGFGGGGGDSGRSYGGGGRNGDSGYGGRGGRSERDYDHEPQHRYEGRSFHDQIMGGGGRHDKDRSRSRSRSRSPNRGTNSYGGSTLTSQHSPPPVVNRDYSPKTNQNPPSPNRENGRDQSQSPYKPVNEPPQDEEGMIPAEDDRKYP